MSLASSQQSFLANALFVSTQNNKLRTKIAISCGQKQEEHKDSVIKKSNDKDKLAKLAIVSLAVGILSVGSVSEAWAAKSGGRIGGQAFRSPAPRSAPRINNNSRTNIYINPRVAPPLGGYGYGYGYGWSPFSFFAPGPSVAVGVGGGFDSLAFFLFLGAAAAVVRRFGRSRRDEDDDEDY